MKGRILILFFIILIGPKISAMEITWDTLIPNQSIVLKDRFHQHGWMPFAKESGLLKNLTNQQQTSLKDILTMVKNSINHYNNIKPGYFSDPKCTGWNYESSLLYTIFYPYIEVREFLFKQDSKKFDTILDRDEK